MAKKNSSSESGSSSSGKSFSPVKMASLLVHLTGMLMFSYGVYYFFYLIKFPKRPGVENDFAGKMKFLTTINAIMQAVYYTICLVNDFIGTNEVLPRKQLPAIRRLKDYMFSALALPVALNVGSTFWSLMAVDRELVFPKAFDSFFPNWLNHVLHTNIVIFILLELFTSFRQYPSRKAGITGLTLFMAGYLVWLHVIKHVSGIWVYPVLDVLPFALRLVFFVVVMAATSVFYLAGEFLSNIVWTKELKMLRQGKKVQ